MLTFVFLVENKWFVHVCVCVGGTEHHFVSPNKIMGCGQHTVPGSLWGGGSRVVHQGCPVAFTVDKTIYQGEEGVRLPCSQLFAVRYLNIGADLCCGLNVLPLSLG